MIGEVDNSYCRVCLQEMGIQNYGIAVEIPCYTRIGKWHGFITFCEPTRFRANLCVDCERLVLEAGLAKLNEKGESNG